MAGIVFTEGSGVADSIFGKSQAPIRMFLEKRGEAFEKTSILPLLFNMDTSKNWAEKYTSMTSMEGFKPVGENGAHPEDDIQEGFSKTFEHMVWKDRFSISREAVDDSKTLDLTKRPLQFIQGYNRTREKFGAQLFGEGIKGNTSFKINGKTFDASCADGLALFSKVHKSKTSKSTQSNRFSDAFSNDALMALESKMQSFTDDNGQILDIAPDTILIPNDYQLKKNVFAAIGADKDPNSANNGFNYNFGRWNVIIWPYLNQFIASGTMPYVLAASGYNKDCGGAIWLDRVALEVKSHIDDDTDANVWNGYSRFTAGFNDWRAFAVGGVSDGDKLISTT